MSDIIILSYVIRLQSVSVLNVELVEWRKAVIFRT